MRGAIPPISTQSRINWLKICRQTRERLTMMSDLRNNAFLFLHYVGL